MNFKDCSIERTLNEPKFSVGERVVFSDGLIISEESSVVCRVFNFYPCMDKWKYDVLMKNQRWPMRDVEEDFLHKIGY